MLKSSIIASIAIIMTPLATANGAAKLITDIGFSSDRTKENRSVILHFAPITLADGKATVTGNTHTVRHFMKAGSATLKATSLPPGDYALSRVEYYLGRSAFQPTDISGTYYRSYCLVDRTLAFTVTPGETAYFGQIALNLPGKVPSKAADLIPIKGMTFDMESAQTSLQWTYGEATQTPVSAVKIDNPDVACSSQTHRVAGWKTPQSGS
jgi:hypothetical protein